MSVARINFQLEFEDSGASIHADVTRSYREKTKGNNCRSEANNGGSKSVPGIGLSTVVGWWCSKCNLFENPLLWDIYHDPGNQFPGDLDGVFFQHAAR